MVISKAGIYRVFNTINNKCYIGSSINLHNREIQHNSKSKSYRGNSIIKRAISKYGSDNFKFEILEEFIFADFATKEYKLELLTSREQFYVDKLDPLYNINKIDVTSNKGTNPFQFVENTRKIKIDVYKRETLDFVETVKGVRQCSKIYNEDGSQISKFCKKGYTSQYLGDYVFCYHNDDINKMFRHRTKFTFKRKDTIPIIQVDKNGNFVKEWRTGSDAEKELKLYKGAVSRVISGEYSHTKNYFFISKN